MAMDSGRSQTFWRAAIAKRRRAGVLPEPVQPELMAACLAAIAVSAQHALLLIGRNPGLQLLV